MASYTYLSSSLKFQTYIQFNMASSLVTLQGFLVSLVSYKHVVGILHLLGFLTGTTYYHTYLILMWWLKRHVNKNSKTRTLVLYRHVLWHLTITLKFNTYLGVLQDTYFGILYILLVYSPGVLKSSSKNKNKKKSHKINTLHWV